MPFSAPPVYQQRPVVNANYQSITSSQTLVKNKVEHEYEQEQEELFTSAHKHGFLGTAKAQIAKTYIISETEEGLVLIDQHAAHERILYEKLKNTYLKQFITKQILLVPIMISIDSIQEKIIEKNKDILNKLGFSIDIFGSEAVFRSMPALLKEHDPKILAMDILTDICNDDASPLTITDKLLDFLATHACHKSIRAGDHLNYDEMNALLRQIEETPNSGQCNHGRPTYIKISLKEIEKLFSRR
jgi:DNA mismatch repair protein MutL